MLEQLKDMIVQYVEADKDAIREDSRFIEDLGFTSYDFMTMVGELEETFDVQVDEGEIIEVKTVGDAIAYIEKLRAE